MVRPRKENPEIPGDQNHPTTTANLKEGHGRIHEVLATPDDSGEERLFLLPRKVKWLHDVGPCYVHRGGSGGGGREGALISVANATSLM